ncbi:MAG: CBS domain-containing protein [Lentisphaerae bacterium]|nr:CBS domain-containing protein [Lentisphaerota bacterium]
MLIENVFFYGGLYMNTQRRSFCNFLQVNNILCGVNEPDGKVVLGKLLELLKRHFPELDMDYTRNEIASREALFPTMIAPHLAVPHARIPGLKEVLVAIACIPDGCDFGGATAAKVMILLLTPVDNPNLHIQLLSALAAEFAEERVTEKISRCASAQDLLNHFSCGLSAIPDYLKAADLMEKFPELLQETDSILDAVRKFAVSRIEELPVIDNTGDLRGILSLADLLKYSLPEHLLWLEDLSPIYELQPFSDMLKTADETKVADIMREEFVMAQVDDPAVKLAKIFLQSNLSQLLIVDKEGKVAGMVSLKNFSAKLFWD